MLKYGAGELHIEGAMTEFVGTTGSVRSSPGFRLSRARGRSRHGSTAELS